MLLYQLPKKSVKDKEPPKEKDSLLTAMPEAPVSPSQQLRDKHGTGGAILRMLGTGLSGGLLGDMLMPEMGRANQLQYASDLESYGTKKEKYDEQSEFQKMFEMVSNGVDDPGDPFARANLAKQYGIKELEYAMNNGEVAPEAKWVSKFNNGTLYRYDENGHYPATPVLDGEGNHITEKMDADMRKTSGWFKRAVPALENMHKLEDRGVDIRRETLTLLAQQAQNEDGIVVPQLFNQALNNLNLNQDQKQYIRNARDLAMIQLRKESGAAIGVSEMFNELEQNLMLRDFSPEGYGYQREARGRKYRALSEGMPTYLLKEFKNEGYFETLDRLRAGSARQNPAVWDGKRSDFSRFKSEDFNKILDTLPPGEYIAPNGKTIIWEGAPQIGGNDPGGEK